MIKTFGIKGFKKFKEISFSDLSRVNIFLGNNNVGKTTLLEAIFALSCGKNIQPLIITSLFRSDEPKSPFEFAEKILSALYDENTKPFKFSFNALERNGKKSEYIHAIEPSNVFAQLKPKLMGNFPKIQNELVGPNVSMEFNLNGRIIEQQIQNLKICDWVVSHNDNKKTVIPVSFPISTIPSSDPFKLARFNNFVTHRNQQDNRMIYASLKREGVFEEFISELSKVFPEILDIDIIPYPDGNTASVNFRTKARGLLPIYSFGDGVQRWYNILGAMVLFRNAVHCIEEIDVAFHPNSHKNLASNLYYYSEYYNNQLFITSHSIEFVDNFLDDLSETGKDIENNVRIITLKNDLEYGAKVRVMSGEEAYRSREKYQLELR